MDQPRGARAARARGFEHFVVTRAARELGLGRSRLARWRTPVVAVHGVWMRGASMRVSAPPPRGRAASTCTPSAIRRDRRSRRECGARSPRSSTRVTGETVHVVAHSLGGVLVRAMLETAAPQRLGRVVCLGPPFAGSRTAARVARLPGGARLIGRSLADLLARGGFDAWRARSEVGIIAGRVPIGFGRLFGSVRRAERRHGRDRGNTARRRARSHRAAGGAHGAALVARVARQASHFLRKGSSSAADPARGGVVRRPSRPPGLSRTPVGRRFSGSSRFRRTALSDSAGWFYSGSGDVSFYQPGGQ